MKKFKYFIPIFLFAALLSRCKEDRNIYLDGNAPAPAQITNINVVPTSGGAILTYRIPSDKNLSYVKAVYHIQPGVTREAKSSYFTDTLAIVGFGDTLSHEVNLYSVGKNEKESSPITITVKPLIPAVDSVFKTLTLDPTFGGVRVSFLNSFRADLSIVVLMDSTGQGNWVPVTADYTDALNGSFYGRGFAPLEKRFAVFVRDRWNNKSDTLIKNLTPWAEKLIPKNLFKTYKLPGDTWQSVQPQYNLEKIWDDIVNVNENIFASNVMTVPQYFTIDLGQSVIFSRMKLYQRSNYPYNGFWVYSFEIWGSNAPDADGGWTHWQKLGAFTSQKPSGLADPSYTAGDMDFVKAGEDFIFDGGLPSVRYIRFVMLSDRAGVGKYQIGELTFWGTLQ